MANSCRTGYSSLSHKPQKKRFPGPFTSHRRQFTDSSAAFPGQRRPRSRNKEPAIKLALASLIRRRVNDSLRGARAQAAPPCDSSLRHFPTTANPLFSNQPGANDCEQTGSQTQVGQPRDADIDTKNHNSCILRANGGLCSCSRPRSAAPRPVSAHRAALASSHKHVHTVPLQHARDSSASCCDATRKQEAAPSS